MYIYTYIIKYYYYYYNVYIYIKIDNAFFLSCLSVRCDILQSVISWFDMINDILGRK